MSGECVISLVLSCHNKDLKWQNSVIAQLQFSFIWQIKDSAPLSCEGKLTPKKGKWAPRGARRDSKGERSPLLPFDMRPDSLGESGMQT